MKKHRQSQRLSATHGLWTALLALSSLALLPSGSSAAASTPPAAEVKDYSLFIGGNLEIPMGKDYAPVKKVLRNDLEVVVNNKVERVSIEDVREYKVIREPKLSSVTATVNVTRTEKTRFGSAKAELQALSNSVAVQNDALDTRDRALGKVVSLGTKIRPSPMAGAPGSAPAPGEPNVKDQLVAQAIDDASRLTMLNDLSNLTYASQKVAESAGRDTSDALETDLEISSPRPLTGAHIVFVTECHEADKPNVLLRKITPKAIGDIGPKPIKVFIEQSGFPIGYVLERERVFLYANGSEIVTNLSDSRVEMTRDQAFRYLLVQYIASHSKDSLPPSPIMGAVAADFRSRVDASQLSQSVDLTINKNGEVTDISTEGGAVKVSPYLETTLKSFRFFPALQNGAPTDGKMKTKLADLFRNT